MSRPLPPCSWSKLNIRERLISKTTTLHARKCSMTFSVDFRFRKIERARARETREERGSSLSPRVPPSRASRVRSFLRPFNTFLLSARYADHASPDRSRKQATLPSRVPEHCIALFCSEALVSSPNLYPPLFKPYESASRINPKVRDRISSVGRALDCRAGGRGFDPRRDPTNTQGLNITVRNEGTRFALQAATPSRGSDEHAKWLSRLQSET